MRQSLDYLYPLVLLFYKSVYYYFSSILIFIFPTMYKFCRERCILCPYYKEGGPVARFWVSLRCSLPYNVNTLSYHLMIISMLEQYHNQWYTHNKNFIQNLWNSILHPSHSIIQNITLDQLGVRISFIRDISINIFNLHKIKNVPWPSKTTFQIRSKNIIRNVMITLYC